MFCDVADCSSSWCTALRATQGPKNKGRWSFFFYRKGRWFWFCVLSAEYSRQQGHLQRPALYTTNKCCYCCVTTARPQQPACSATAYFVPFPAFHGDTVQNFYAEIFSKNKNFTTASVSNYNSFGFFNPSLPIILFKNFIQNTIFLSWLTLLIKIFQE